MPAPELSISWLYHNIGQVVVIMKKGKWYCAVQAMNIIKLAKLPGSAYGLGKAKMK